MITKPRPKSPRMEDKAPELAKAYLLLLQSEKFLKWKTKQEPPDNVKLEDWQAQLSVDEPHFSPQQLADAWGVSDETIRQVFKNEQGVLRLPSRQADGKKRSYVSLKIPKSVAERVHRRLSAVPQ